MIHTLFKIRTLTLDVTLQPFLNMNVFYNNVNITYILVVGLLNHLDMVLEL